MKKKRDNEKFFLAVLLCGLFFMPLGLFAQEKTTVTISKKGVTLKEVIADLKEQTTYDFFYDSGLSALNETFDIDVKDKEVQVVLDEILPPLGLEYAVQRNLIIIREKLAQSVDEPMTIKGKVSDVRGSTMPGVTVLVKGTTIGTSTNVDGRFELSLPRQDKVDLVFSFIGMESQELAYTGQEELEVVMREEITEIEEVVVTGYQTIDRRKNTSAVTSVKAEDIMIPGAMTIDKMLEGQIPDLMVMTNSGESGVAPKIRIRGTSTLIGNREPLWVVDGVIVQDPVQISPDELNDPDYINRIGNAISGLNPQDIDRIDVLKDASATALYGTKAANGVIVITTKRGHIGEPEISYRGTASLKLRPRYSDRNIDLMSAKERLNVSRELAEGHYEYHSNMDWVGYEKLLQDLYNKKISYDEFQKLAQTYEDANTDWFKLLTQDAFSSSHTLSITGGTEKVRYYSSLSANFEEDVVKPNDEKRYAGVVNLDMNLTPWLAASFNMNGYTSKRKYYQDEIAPINYAYNTSRAIPAYFEDREYFYYKKMGGADTYNYNILNELENSYKKQEISSATFRTNLDIRPWEWIKISAILSYTFSNTDMENYWGPETHYASSLRQAEYGAEQNSEYSLMPYGGELNKESIRNKSYMFRLQADVNKYWGMNMQHNIAASAGMEVNSTKYDAFHMTMRGYMPERGKQFSISQVGNFPAYDNWLASNVPIVTDNLTNMLSWYGSVSYSYGNWFTINANMRYDGSNQFGEKSREKILPIWSASFNYNLIEHFREKQNFIDDLRLKMSYGYQGNMLDDQSPVMVISKKPEDTHYGEFVSEIAIYPNPTLRWEKTGSLNVGLEFSMFKSRLMMEASYYRKKTKDAYMEKEISGVNGMTSYVINSGIIINSGYDISLTVNPIRKDYLRWYISTSFSRACNEINTQPGAEVFEYSDFLNGTAIIKGKSVSSFYSYKFIGLDPNNGVPLFDDMEDEKEKLIGKSKYEVFTQVLEESGPREPKIFGGLSTTVNYKRWRLNASFAYSLGAKTRQFAIYPNGDSHIRPEDNLNKVFLNRWQHPGDENYTNIPSLYPYVNDYIYHWSYGASNIPTIARDIWTMYNYSNVRVVSANYLKCTTIGLNYNINTEKIGISRLELSVSVNNPFIWTSKELKGQTPVQNGFTEIQLSERPTFNLGVNITF